MYTKQKNLMPKAFLTVFWVVLVPILMSSCMSDSENNFVESNSCYVSAVTFPSFRIKHTTKASDGVTDSTYYSTYAASGHVFTINQREDDKQKGLLIENRDSLPFNTDLSRVVMNLSYVGAIVYHRSSDAWDDEPWTTYNSEDSIDLRKPLHIRVLATDNTERVYTLKVNAHTVAPDSLSWSDVNTAHELDGTCPMRALAWDNEMGVLVNDGNAVLWMTHALSDRGNWERRVTNLPTNTDVASLCKSSSTLFVSTADGRLFSSADGGDWSELESIAGLRLLGTSEDRLYVIYDRAIHSTSFGNMDWQAEALDEDVSLLPEEEVAMLAYEQTDGLARLLLLGNRKNSDATEEDALQDTTAVVWSKSWTSFEQESSETWMHYTRNWENTQALPRFTQINLMRYDGMLMLAAGESRDGKVKALERFYISKDNGLTWWRYQTILPPDDVMGVDGYLTTTVDNENFLWIMAGGKVYRGRINRLGFRH